MPIWVELSLIAGEDVAWGREGVDVLIFMPTVSVWIPSVGVAVLVLSIRCGESFSFEGVASLANAAAKMTVFFVKDIMSDDFTFSWCESFIIVGLVGMLLSLLFGGGDPVIFSGVLSSLILTVALFSVIDRELSMLLVEANWLRRECWFPVLLHF